MADSIGIPQGARSQLQLKPAHIYWIILLVAAAIYLGCVVSPPSLFDDVDAVQAQTARNMLTSHDWVTARIDGLAYLDKAPLVYWLVASSYNVFGVHDWAARLPIAFSVIALCLLTAAFGMWAMGERAGFYAGLCMATCVGLFLFTRILIPDALLTFTIALSLWALLRALEEDEPRPRLWAFVLAASLGVGLLAKSLIALIFPVAIAVIYLLITRQFFSVRTWKRLNPVSGVLVVIVIAAPWHILAALRNPPLFAFTLQSGPGQYHGFLWNYFIKEQLLRFLNRRYPRDYDTVPRLWFWLLHLVWLFPWTPYLPAAAKLSFKPVDRAGRARLLALCWIGFVLIFFTFSTTQEYYSMPIYPALALLIGSGMALEGKAFQIGTRLLTIIFAIAAIAAIGILIAVRQVPTPGDISQALTSNPGAYRLSLGHMEDLTLKSFAYLRLPLGIAAAAFVLGIVATLGTSRKRVYLAVAVAMVLFFHAARVALVVFDPFLCSRPLVETLEHSPEGNLIVDHHYYWYSSVFFYTNRRALLLNGRVFNLIYGSYSPGAAEIFIDDGQFQDIWQKPERYYVFTKSEDADRLQALVGSKQFIAVGASGGKSLFTNHPLPSASPGNTP